MAEGAAARVGAAAAWVSRRGWLVAGLLGFAIFAWLHSVPTFPDPDAYYHGAMAQAAWSNDLPTALPQAWFTELRNTFYDQHLLYHYILAPFVALLGIPLGLKFASALLGGVAVGTLYAVAKALGARYPWVAVSIALATPAWLYRLGLVKVTPLAGSILLVSLVLAARRRPLALGMLAMAFTYVYIGFGLLPLVVTTYLLVDWLACRKPELGGRALAAAAAWIGSAAGFVVSPYFPGSLGQFISQFLAIGVANQGAVGVAAEWLPATPGWAASYAAVAALALASAIAAAILSPRRRATAAVAVAACAFLATARSRRYVEYATPLIAIAFVVAVPLEAAGSAVAGWWRRRRAAVSAVALAVALGVGYGISVTRSGLDKLFPASGFGAACTWIRENVAPGTLVYNVNWGEWPLLYSCRSDLRYVAGLDMRFMYRAFPELALRYQDIARGKVLGTDLVGAIGGEFGSSLAVVTENNTTTAQALAEAPGTREVYGDSRVQVFELNAAAE